MKANVYHGKRDVRVETVPDPTPLDPRDCVVKVTLSAICGSDLHLYNGFVPAVMRGDILGHEFMGEVVEVGSEVKNLRVGDRVVVPFPIACGQCFFCKKEMYSLCDNTNPNAALAEKMFGRSPCGIFGYSHMLGGYAGGQAEYVRVPFADVGPLKLEDGLSDEQVLFLSDILPTGYMAVEACALEPGDTVAIWGCGPVGLFAIQSARVLGAGRVIAIDRFAPRLRLAEKFGAETINYETTDVAEALDEKTGGMGPDACVDAVGLEAHTPSALGAVDRLKQALMVETDRPVALRQAIRACRKGGTVSIPGVYGGFADTIPLGALMNKALTIKTGQTHVQRYMRPLLERIRAGDFDTTSIITHRLPLDEAPRGFELFVDKADDCVKVVLKP